MAIKLVVLVFEGMIVIIDVILLLTGIYEKVYLIKPTISKITKGERYIICSNLNTELVNRTNIFDQKHGSQKY